MDPATLCCPNLACPARGHVGQGNIGIHSRQHQRFICTQCRKTCAATKGTALSRLRTPSRPCGGGWGATTPRTTGIGRGRWGREPCGEPGRPQHGCEAPDTGTHRQRWQPGGPIQVWTRREVVLFRVPPWPQPQGLYEVCKRNACGTERVRRACKEAKSAGHGSDIPVRERLPV